MELSYNYRVYLAMLNTTDSEGLTGMELRQLGLQMLKDIWPKVKRWQRAEVKRFGPEIVEGVEIALGCLSMDNFEWALNRLSHQRQLPKGLTKTARDIHEQLMEITELFNRLMRLKLLVASSLKD